VWFSEPDAYTRAREKLMGQGFTLVHENGARAAARFAYFETQLPGGLMIEIAEALTPAVRDVFESVRQSATQWDGSDPVRVIGA
jgi:hypothetical protein